MIERRKFAFTRVDAVVTRVLLIGLAVVYPLLALLPRVIAWIGGRALQVVTAVSTDGPVVPGATGAGASARFDRTVVWTIEHPSASQWLFDLMPGMLTWVLILVGCLLAGRMVRSTLAGEPFGAAGVRRVRGLALVVVAYGVLVPNLQNVTNIGVLWSVDRARVLAAVFDLAGFGVPLVIGIFLFVVAEAFAIGRRLAEDVEGLV